MLDWLVRRPVLAKADGIMRHHIDDALAHQGGQADRRAAVIGEDKEGAAIGNGPAMKRDAVHRRCHAVFADTVMHIASRGAVTAVGILAADAGVVRSGQVGRSADQRRAGRQDGLDGLLASDAGGKLLRLRRQALLPGADSLVDGGVEIAFYRGIESRGVSGVVTRLPGFACGAAAAADGAPGIADLGRNFKRCVRPADGGACALDFFGTQRGAVGTGSAGFLRRAITDHGAAPDQARPCGIGTSLGNRCRHGIDVVAVNGEHLPAIGFETRCRVLGDGEVGAAVDRDAIVVEQHDQP